MKFRLFIEEIWAKIVVGTLIYHWKSILAVGSKSGSNLAVGLPYYHWSRRINTDVIWAVRSCCMKEGKYHQKITDISPIYHRYITDISPIFCHQRRFFQKISNISPRTDILPIFWRYLRKYLLSDFSPWNIVSTPPDTRYIGYISRYFPPCSDSTHLKNINNKKMRRKE